MRGVLGIFDKICPMHRYDNAPNPNGQCFDFCIIMRGIVTKMNARAISSGTTEKDFPT